MTTKQIIYNWLKDNGYHGLVCTDIPCGCLLEDLMTCGECNKDCVAGHKETVDAETQCGCDGEGTEHWHVTDSYDKAKSFAEKDHIENSQEWVCECGQMCEPCSPEWRWNGQDWEHYHGYPIGHVSATRKGGGK